MYKKKAALHYVVFEDAYVAIYDTENGDEVQEI